MLSHFLSILRIYLFSTRHNDIISSTRCDTKPIVWEQCIMMVVAGAFMCMYGFVCMALWFARELPHFFGNKQITHEGISVYITKTRSDVNKSQTRCWPTHRTAAQHQTESQHAIWCVVYCCIWHHTRSVYARVDTLSQGDGRQKDKRKIIFTENEVNFPQVIQRVTESTGVKREGERWWHLQNHP